ncbi:specifically androgen-regulated gene protein-like isoform X1 [Sebastes umbrosus]|uniref:specifically androgen-regulated gene protein-like isoform X1 n=1 Tax=Sebastes umbrosus TaxID=72105 RepID=UPI00189FE716|nr:specifically androgen-regulated gene protein-like isoform X1 [Sebastes umbrosus]
MPKSDTWPGGVAMEPLSYLDSAGSCDSVISMNSAYSEDSMEHLSADERACLMYLEETIEALEQQEDSGLSNDEPDPGFQADTKGQMRANYISSLKSDEFGKDQTSDSGSIEDKAEHHALSPTSEPQSSNTKDLQTSVNLMTQPEPPATELVTDCKIHPTATQLSVFTDGYGQLKIVPSASLSPGYLSEIDTVVIPPPSDFMDEPVLPKQPRDLIKDLRPSARVSNKKPGATVDLEQLCQRASVKRTSLSTSVTQERPNKPPDLSLLTVSSGPLMSPPPEAAEPRSPPVVAPKPKMLPANILLKPHKAGSDGYSSPTSSDRLLLDHQRVRMEALRKLGLLPAEGDSSPVLSPDASPTTRKSWTAPASPISPLGSHTPPFKPRYNRVDSSPGTCVPLHSPAAASPLAAATAPAVQPDEVLPAPAAFSDPVGPPLSDNELSDVKDASEVNAQVNTPPLTPSAMIRHLTPPRFVGVKSASPEPPLTPSAMIKHLTPPRFVGVKSASPEPPLTPSAMIRHLTPPRCVGVKSATLERSGLGLSSLMASQDSNKGSLASQLRNNRARPASLGGGTEFTRAGGEGSQVGLATSKEPDLRRSLPAHTGFQSLGDSPNLPRSEGISVLICPKAENGEDRRNALKKLGLLRD